MWGQGAARIGGSSGANPCAEALVRQQPVVVYEAVRLAPDFARAQFELGAALYARGDAAGGVQHLRVAVRLGDANAADYLRKLGR